MAPTLYMYVCVEIAICAEEVLSLKACHVATVYRSTLEEISAVKEI